MLSLLVKRFFRFFLSLYRSNFGFRTGFAFDEFAAVVGIQQDLFQFGDQRVARVSAGALVIECIFRQFINVGQEVSFLNASFADRFRNTQLSFNAFQPCQQFLDFRCGAVAWCGEAQVIGDFSVTTTSLRTVVLAERGLLGRVVIRVIADNVADQQGVGQTVRNMELGAQLCAIE
ncbi:Uncharacterised protein [Klebsiella pneumoniae subsp. ozaenae]|uniref:Uncharacterized protein n=1 Tax=Klebsiella pneumoniae subsp. ozaenae TaxID=574 RepID=A0A377ZID7_KLEPO|nr:Uncharacterised protein [Klebsiella pneumoniae subsp. ozaenae]